MTTRIKTAVSIAAAILFLWAGRSIAASSGDASLDAAIEKANSEFLGAMKTGDASTIAAPYAEDGIFVMPDGSAIRGRAEIEKMYRTRFAQFGLPASTTLKSRAVSLDEDLAYESGDAEATVTREGKPTVVKSRYLTVWRRGENGEWKIIRNLVFAATPAKTP